MSERVSVQPKMAEVRDKSEIDARRRHAAYVEEQKIIKAEAIRIETGRFLLWASKHDIPYDFFHYKHKGNERVLASDGHDISAHRLKGWLVASRVALYTDSEGEFGHQQLQLGVDTFGRIAEKPGESRFYKEDFYRGATTESLAKYTLDQIHVRIAALCVEHSIEWDMPEQWFS